MSPKPVQRAPNVKRLTVVDDRDARTDLQIARFRPIYPEEPHPATRSRSWLCELTREMSACEQHVLYTHRADIGLEWLNSVQYQVAGSKEPFDIAYHQQLLTAVQRQAPAV